MKSASPQPTRRSHPQRLRRPGPLLNGSRLSCGQLIGKVVSKQKQRLRDIPVKVQ